MLYPWNPADGLAKCKDERTLEWPLPFSDRYGLLLNDAQQVPNDILCFLPCSGHHFVPGNPYLGRE